MADIKAKFGTATSFTLTSANLTDSPTAGWQSDAVDNTSDLFLDALVHVELAAVNTAPGGLQQILLFAFALVDSSASAYTSSGDGTPSGSVGTITFPDVETKQILMPSLGRIDYPVQNKAINAGPFSVARCFGGVLPPKWGICMINKSGMTLNVTAIKWRGVYATN